MSKMNVKLASLALSAAFLAGSVPVLAATFQDVPNAYWADQYINYLTNKNVITGYPDNTFRPSKDVTRAEFAVMLAKSMNLPTGSASSSAFADVPASHWAAQAIKSVAGQGWIAGYPGNRFLPNQPISMAEMYTIMSKAGVKTQVSDSQATTILNQFSDAGNVPDWARVSVATAVNLGVDVSEVTPNTLDPNMPATRAAVATSMAKLLNESFRDASGEVVADKGEAVNVTGTLQATATPGEWVLVTSDNKRYVLNDTDAYKNQSWFKLGNTVSLKGNIDDKTSTSTRWVVDVNSLMATSPQENKVAITGELRPSTSTNGAWVVRTDEGKVYRLLDPSQYKNESWFKYGTRVSLEGNTRSDVALPQADGTAVIVSDLEVAQAMDARTFTATLHKTTEAGGWYVTDPSNSQNLVLLNVDSYKNQAWFKDGAQVMVSGDVRTDVPNVYMQGPVLQVSELRQPASAVQGTQTVNIYYPNRLNIVRDPLLQLGDPAPRILQGPNIPQKAVEAVLEGPSQVERVLGFYTSDDVAKLKLETVNIQADGTAKVVLEAPANFKFSNNTTAQRLNEQLDRTLRQFTGVQDVNVAIQDPANAVIWSSGN